MEITFTKEESNWFTRKKIVYSQIKSGITENSEMTEEMYNYIAKYNKIYQELKELKKEIVDKYYIPIKKKKPNHKYSNKKTSKQQCAEFMNIVLDRFYSKYPEEKNIKY